jgi:serine protease
MRMKSFFASLAVAALLAVGVAPSSQAVIQPEEKVSGIIVQYSTGVQPQDEKGNITGADLVGVEVASEELGAGLYNLKFQKPIPLSMVQIWIKRMLRDNKIQWADPDRAIETTGISTRDFKITPFSKARPASEPRSLRAAAAVTSGAPQRARVRLSWSAPANRYGAKIVGYRILFSANAGRSYQTLISNTFSRDTRVFLTDGIKAGVDYRFRVRAITNDGSGPDVVGAASRAASALVRTSPKPVSVVTTTLVGPGNANFLPQSLSDRGGFALKKVKYRAIATATDIDSAESGLCNEKRCRFPNLIADVSYNIEIIATNPRGSSSSNGAAKINDLFYPVQWYLSGQYGVSMPAAWLYSKGANDKVVAVIDTGIMEHQQLDTILTRNRDGSIYGYDFVSDVNSAADGDGEDPDPTDSGGGDYHGTQVAGILAAKHDFLGTAGVSPGIKVLPIRALGRDGGTVGDLIKAINWAAGEKFTGIPRNRFPVSVINLSLGATEPLPCSGGYETVFNSVTAKGITVVAAAGNEGRNSLSFPANCSSVITVVASQALGDRASYSNYGDGADIAAPGGESSVPSSESPDSQGRILSPAIDGVGGSGYGLAEGTSMAAPVVSGIIALMYSVHPTITPAQVKNVLGKSVKAFAPNSTCLTLGGCGAGIVNAHRALALASGLR